MGKYIRGSPAQIDTEYILKIKNRKSTYKIDFFYKPFARMKFNLYTFVAY